MSELNKLQGSDHCPVYAVMRDAVTIDGVEYDLRDIMNPRGMFLSGKRQREYSTTSDLLPLSGKLIPEFFGRRNIRDMFARKPSLPQSQSHSMSSKDAEVSGVTAASQISSPTESVSAMNDFAEGSRDNSVMVTTSFLSAVVRKRSASVTTSSRSIKRGKSGSTTATLPVTGKVTGKGQQSLKGFFKSTTTFDLRNPNAVQGRQSSQISLTDDTVGRSLTSARDLAETRPAPNHNMEPAKADSAIQRPCKTSVRCTSGESQSASNSPNDSRRATIHLQENVHDPIESKESWSKLFTKPTAPRCEGHDEPCISLLTKKPGMNLGRSFWMCPRPLGPSGAKEKNTQWRCQTFIWCSDWNHNAKNA